MVAPINWCHFLDTFPSWSYLGREFLHLGSGVVHSELVCSASEFLVILWVYISCFFDPFVRLLDGVLISRSGSPKMSSQFSLGGSNAQLHGCQRDRLSLAEILSYLAEQNRQFRK